MTAWTKLAFGLCIIALAAGISLAALMWAALVTAVEAAGFWLEVVLG